MYITGSAFRLTPEVSSMKLTFENLTFYKSGVAVIGVSGEGQALAFSFSGGRIFAPDKRFVGTYNIGYPTNLEWAFNSSNYSFSIDHKIIKKRNTKPSFAIQRFFLNTTGLEISADAKMYCPNISHSLTFNENYLALESLTGYINNNSDFNFRVFDSSIVLYNAVGNTLTGVITGVVPSQGALTFSFKDVDTSRFDSIVQYFALFNTSLGPISGLFTSNRVSGLDRVVSNLSSYESGVSILGVFDGSGVSGNAFSFTQTAVRHVLDYTLSSTNLRGETKPKIVTITLEPESPISNSTYLSEYVTGVTILNEGEYLYPPTLKVTGYYYVNGLNWDLRSIIFNSGCSGNLPVIFSGISSGRGASGILKSTRVLMSGIYGEPLRYYYLPQSFEMISGGTGYLEPPLAILQTGIYSNCYDVASQYNATYSLYKPFRASGSIDYQAAYLTGEVLVRTGIVNVSQTGYKVTGIEFTNIGSGYTSGLFPRLSFERAVGDTCTSNATGVFRMKSTGLYLFPNSWTISTGLSSTNLIGMTQFTGTGFLGETDNYLNIEIGYTGLDNTQPIVAKLTVSMSGANTIVHYITGAKSYDTSTGFLKKKNNLDIILFNVGSALSFSLTQDELDDYYNSSEYLNNDATISLGDLDF